MDCNLKNWRGKKLCQFVARYDRKFQPHVRKIWGWTSDEIEALKETIYVRDVCVRCGKTIERQA